MWKEYKQLNEGEVPGKKKPVFCVIDTISLTSEEKRRALEVVNLIKKKKTGTIKLKT